MEKILKQCCLTACSVAAMALTTSFAMAEDFQPYVSLFGGASLLNDPKMDATVGDHYTFHFNTGYLIGAAAGLKWNDHLRSEIEFSHSSWNAKGLTTVATNTGVPSTFNADAKGSISTNYLLGNLWVDLPTGSSITPYVGGGLGIGWADGQIDDPTPANNHYLSGGGSGFAFQVGGGVNVSLADHISVDVGYRLKDLTHIGFTLPVAGGSPFSPTNLLSHNFQVGLTYRF